MQISKRDIKLLIGLACFLVLAASYMFGYRRYSKERDTLQEEIDTLSVRYADLSAKEANRDKYIQGTKENEEAVLAITSQYPSDITTENEIYYTKLIEEKTEAKISQLSYTEPESFYIEESQADGTAITGYKATSTISVEGDYNEFKSIIAYINSCTERRVIDSINLSADATSGTLTGTIAFNSYYLTGADCTFTPNTIPAKAAGNGVDNIFGSQVNG